MIFLFMLIVIYCSYSNPAFDAKIKGITDKVVVVPTLGLRAGQYHGWWDLNPLTFTRINDGTSEWVTVNTPWQT